MQKLEGCVADKIIAGYSTLAHRQYGKYYKDWMQFAYENNFNYMQPLASQAITFLANLTGACQDKASSALCLAVLPEYENVFHSKLVSTLHKAERR